MESNERSFTECGLCMLDVPTLKLLNQNGLTECAVSFEFVDRRLQVLPMIADLYVMPVEPQYGNRLPRRRAGAFRK
jgi:hypothetical protein